MTLTHKAQEMILTDVSDTIHADSLAMFALNIEILLADVTKPKKSKILTLTWPVTSSVTSGSNFLPVALYPIAPFSTGLSNGVWNLEIGPVVWEISGGPLGPPTPAGRVTNQTPAGRGLRKSWIQADPSHVSGFNYAISGKKSAKSHDNACWNYISIKNAVNLLKRAYKVDLRVQKVQRLWSDIPLHNGTDNVIMNEIYARIHPFITYHRGVKYLMPFIPDTF